MGPEVAHFPQVKWALIEWVEFSHPEHTGMTQFNSVQLLSHVQLFATPWTAARQAFPIHHLQAMLNMHQRSGHFSPPNSFMPGWLATVKENPSKFPGEKWAQAAAGDPEKGLLSARVNLSWTWTSIWLTKIVNNANLCTQTQWGQTKWNRKQKKKKKKKNHTVRSNKMKQKKGKKKKKVYCRAKKGEWVVCAQNPQTAWWFVGDVIGKIWGEASENVVLFWLVLQDSCAQADIVILYLCRGLGSYQKTQR